MSEREYGSIEHASDAASPAGQDRKLYRKPSFRSEQVFETMALQCGKISGTSGACNMVKQAS